MKYKLPSFFIEVSWCRFLLNEFSAPSKVSSKLCYVAFGWPDSHFFSVIMLLHDESCNEMELQGGVTLYGIFYLPVNYTELQKWAFYCILRSIGLKVDFFFSIFFWRTNKTKSKTKGGWKDDVMGRLWLETAFSQMHVNISQMLTVISREALCRLKNNILIITPVNQILL